MTDNVVSCAAFIVAAVVPFFIVLRWSGAGFVLAVLFGRAIVHGANVIVPHREPVDAVFVGLWVALGWAFMTAWCLGCVAVVAMARYFFPGRKEPALGRARTFHDPIASDPTS